MPRANAHQLWLPRPRRRLRAGLTQLLFAITGFAAGLAVTRMTVSPAVPTGRVIDLLMTIGFGVLGTMTVIFTLLFLVLQWAATTLSPRLSLFRDDPIVWRTYALVVGVFVYCVTASLSIGRRDQVSAVIPLSAVLLALVTVALIRNLVLRAFASIQLAPTLAKLTALGREVLERLPPDDHAEPKSELGEPTTAVIWDGPGRVLRQLHLDRLVSAARRANGVIAMRQQVGETLVPGSVVADLYGAVAPAEVRNALVTGGERTFGHDPLLAPRLLADIGLHALSSAVNDPATAVQALDCLHELLLLAGTRAGHSGRITDPDGSLRVVLAMPSWDRYLATSLDDIIAARGPSPMVRRRLQEVLDDLVRQAEPQHQAAVRLRMDALSGGTIEMPR